MKICTHDYNKMKISYVGYWKKIKEYESSRSLHQRPATSQLMAGLWKTENFPSVGKDEEK